MVQSVTDLEEKDMLDVRAKMAKKSGMKGEPFNPAIDSVKEAGLPGWLKEAVFYEIYPQSFKDTNGDGIGDIPGIIEKLDYIKELGCNALWLNPCFDSPFGDAGYDVADYYKVAPRYGTNEDLFRLFREAHKREMHVLLDLVPGHTAITHPWFQASMKAERNEFTDRYIWTDNIWTSPKDNACIRGISDRDGSAVTNFFSHQPALNYGYYEITESWQQPMDAPGPRATLEAMKDVMRFWLSGGCDGFRVDMAGSLVKGDPEGKGIQLLWEDVRAFLNKEFPHAAMISEWGEPDRSLQAGFHMDFLLHFGPSHYNDLFRCEEPYFSSRGKGDVKEFVARYLSNYEKTGGKGLICIPSGNHDMDRLARYLTEAESKLAMAFLYTMPGAPFLYYGDEIGMNYVEGLVSKEGGYNRTGSRTPMQWDDTANAGFSAGSPASLYLPIDPSEARPTVKNQMERADSLYHFVKKMIALRKEHPALGNTAGISFTEVSYPLCYERFCDEERLTVTIDPKALTVEIRDGEKTVLSECFR